MKLFKKSWNFLNFFPWFENTFVQLYQKCHFQLEENWVEATERITASLDINFQQWMLFSHWNIKIICFQVWINSWSLNVIIFNLWRGGWKIQQYFLLFTGSLCWTTVNNCPTVWFIYQSQHRTLADKIIHFRSYCKCNIWIIWQFLDWMVKAVRLRN